MQKYTPFLVKFNYFHTQSINKCQIVHQFVTIFTKLNNCAAAACLLNILAATHTTFVAPRLKYSTYPRSGAVHSLSLFVCPVCFFCETESKFAHKNGAETRTSKSTNHCRGFIHKSQRVCVGNEINRIFNSSLA